MVDVERALADLGDHVEHPRFGDLSAAVVAHLRHERRPDRRPARRRWLVAVAVAVTVVAATVALPAPREALADWLGIGAVHIVRTDKPARPIGTSLRLGRQVTLDDARATAGAAVLSPPALGPPSSVYAGEPSTTSVTLLWAPNDRLPEVHGTGVGLLLTEIPGSIDRQLLGKVIGPDTTIESVGVGPAAGYWISGAQHELFYYDARGMPLPDTTRLAANTLLWSADGVTYRLESLLTRDAAVALAATLR